MKQKDSYLIGKSKKSTAMEFSERKAHQLQTKFNLSDADIRRWKHRKRIPDMYAEKDFRTDRLPKKELNHLKKLLKHPLIQYKVLSDATNIKHQVIWDWIKRREAAKGPHPFRQHRLLAELRKGGKTINALLIREDLHTIFEQVPWLNAQQCYKDIVPSGKFNQWRTSDPNDQILTKGELRKITTRVKQIAKLLN
ncbi:MAG: hypothetical protein AAFV80_07500 [Bacteroidota bacterium]